MGEKTGFSRVRKESPNIKAPLTEDSLKDLLLDAHARTEVVFDISAKG